MHSTPRLAQGKSKTTHHVRLKIASPTMPSADSTQECIDLSQIIYATEPLSKKSKKTLTTNTAAEHAPAVGTATEHADYTTAQNTKSYQSLAVEMLEEQTTPEQRRQSKFRLVLFRRSPHCNIINTTVSYLHLLTYF